MEKRRQRSSSGEIFSFPSIPNKEQDVSSLDPFKDSPADHLFFNGRLLPHVFPLTPAKCNSPCGTSRTSSVSSKDSFSLMSSRSNSTSSRNSSQSSCSSARTSSSDGSERQLLYHYGGRGRACKATTASKMVMAQLYGDSQRWQHIVPSGLQREGSIKRKNSGGGAAVKKRSNDHDRKKDVGLFRRILRAFLMVCRECHAMEPSRKEDVMQRRQGL